MTPESEDNALGNLKAEATLSRIGQLTLPFFEQMDIIRKSP